MSSPNTSLDLTLDGGALTEPVVRFNPYKLATTATREGDEYVLDGTKTFVPLAGEVLVADNGSSDSSRQVARDRGAIVLQYPGIRVSEVRNRAAGVARGEVLVFVDADHELDPNWIPHAIETLLASKAAAVGAGYYAPDDGTWVQKMYDSFRLRTPGLRRVDWLGSGSLAVWRRTFQEVGGFDNRLETCEDVDFCQRLRLGQRSAHVAHSGSWNSSSASMNDCCTSAKPRKPDRIQPFTSGKGALPQ